MGLQKNSKIPFSGNQEVICHVQDVSEVFFDDAFMSQIANETNRYAREFINSKQNNLPPWPRAHDWHNVDSGELYVHFALQMLNGHYSEAIGKNIFN